MLLFSCYIVSDSLRPHCSAPGSPVLHHLLESARIHVHWVGDAIQPSHPLSTPSPAFSLSQHQGLLQWISSSCQVAKDWNLGHKESWAWKSWCFWTVVLEKTLESPLDIKEIKLVNPIGNQSWIFIGRTDAEAETLILWSPDANNWVTGKDPDSGKDWRQEEKGTT